MRHKHLTGSPVELLEGAETAPRANRVLHHTPEAFDRIEVMAAVGGEEMELQLSRIMCHSGGKLFGPMDATTIDDHHDLLIGFAKDVHDLMQILAQGFCVKMRHDLIEDFRGAILDGTNDAEQDATGDATPRALLGPCVAFERLMPCALAVAQRMGGQACALGAAPPAHPVLWLWLNGWVDRRARWARRHQPTLGRAKRHSTVSSS